MSHYTDIGFNVRKPEDLDYIISLLEENHQKLPGLCMYWDIKENPDNNLMMKNFEDFRFFAKGDLKSKWIDDFFVTIDNKNISTCNIAEIKSKKDEKYFPIVKIEKNEIPFWFSGFNADIFWTDNNGKEDDIVKIVSYANSINIIDVNKKKTDDKFANESYISKFMITNNKDDLDNGFVSGIINNWGLKKNPFTKNKFYMIDIVCLGLNFKILADPKLINKKYLKIGNILRGEFWNTVVIVADNHPDYF